MNRIEKKFLSLIFVVAYTMPLCADHAPHNASPYLAFRSISVNAALELAGWQYKINRCDMPKKYGSLTITPFYTQSFKPDDITDCLFGPDLVENPAPQARDCSPNCTPCECSSQVIVVSGTDVANRGERDWLADYFGLPTDFQSVLSFCPKIRNVAVDFNFYLGLDSWAQGLFFRVHAPVVWSRWNLNFDEEVIAAGVNDHNRGYFSDLSVPREDLVTNAAAFLSGVETPTITGSTGAPVTNPIGSPIVFQPLKFSKIPVGCTTPGWDDDEFRLSDIEMAFGYNFACDTDYHFGVELRLSAPTGNRPCAEFLFAPVIGNGKQWKLGGGLTMHYIFFRDEKKDGELGFWIDANVQHLFSARQLRSFDLADRPNSRYALAEKLGTTRLPVHLAGASDAGYEWQDEFAPVANLTTSLVKVSVAVEGDVVIKFAYTRDSGAQADLGFEFWGRSCECIQPLVGCPPLAVSQLNAWALKGDAYVVGFADDDGEANTDVPVRLAATQSEATIHEGTNNFQSGLGGIAPTRNPGIDNAVLAVDSDADDVLDFVTDGQTNSSNPPVFITQNVIGYNDASTKGISYKVFAHLSKTWHDREYAPFLGVGASGEFSHRAFTEQGCACPSDEPLCQPSCNDCALNQWSVWIKGGISFE